MVASGRFARGSIAPGEMDAEFEDFDPEGEGERTGVAEAPSTASTQALLGPYRLVAQFESGDAAEVYLAYKRSQFGFIRRAVVKWVKSERSDFQEFRAQLLDEARGLALLEHPSIVNILDIEEGPFGVYLAMEYVYGKDLGAIMRYLRNLGENLPHLHVCMILVSVLRGLHHAHSAVGNDGKPLNIVHRDVNPDNILVSSEGDVKLTDFGVLRMRSRIQDQTDPGVVKGKIPYMSPEYLIDQTTDHKTDVYAAGVLFAELMSDAPIFGDKSGIPLMKEIANNGFPAHVLESERIPTALLEVIRRATAFDPDNRYETALAMADQIERWIESEGLYASPRLLSIFLQSRGLISDSAKDKLYDSEEQLQSLFEPPPLDTVETSPDSIDPGDATDDLSGDMASGDLDESVALIEPDAPNVETTIPGELEVSDDAPESLVPAEASEIEGLDALIEVEEPVTELAFDVSALGVEAEEELVEVEVEVEVEEGLPEVELAFEEPADPEASDDVEATVVKTVSEKSPVDSTADDAPKAPPEDEIDAELAFFGEKIG